MVSCRNFEVSCHGEGESKVYSLEVVGIAEQLIIAATNVSLHASNATTNAGGTNLMCFARHGAMPSMALHDYSIDINKGPLVIQSPKLGRWFIAILPVNISSKFGGIQNPSVCYFLYAQVRECPPGKAGLNCTSERYMLEVGLYSYEFSS